MITIKDPGNVAAGLAIMIGIGTALTSKSETPGTTVMFNLQCVEEIECVFLSGPILCSHKTLYDGFYQCVNPVTRYRY